MDVPAAPMSLRNLLGATDTHNEIAIAAAARTENSESITQWKANDVERLLACLDASHAWAPATVLTLLGLLKLLGREEKCNSPLYSPKSVATLAALAGIIQPEMPQSKDDVVVNEALKVLANLFFLRNETISDLVTDPFLEGVMRLTKAQNLSLERIFLLYRILFLVSTSSTLVRNILKHGTHYYQPLLDHIYNCEEAPAPPFTRVAALSEVLKTMFNLGMHSLSAAPSSANIFSAETLNTVAKTLTVFEPPKPYPMSAPYSHAIHVFLNSVNPPGPWCTPQLIARLIDQVLSVEFQHLFEDEVGLSSQTTAVSPAGTRPANDRVPPLLHLLSNVYPNAPEPVRAVIRDRLIPSNMDRSHPTHQGNTVANHLVALLTRIGDTNLRQSAEELLLTLFGGNVSDLVAYTGFGPAAGFLVNHGLLTPELLAAAGKDPNVNPVTGQTWEAEQEITSELAKMTDEEKEAEAERLFVAFEKLNRLGVIKAIDPTTGLEIGTGHKPTTSDTTRMNADRKT